LWQRTRDPETARAEHLSRVIERLLDARRDTERDSDLSRDFALAAVAAADLAGAEQLPGARLQCLLGIALTEAGLYRRAHSVLQRALAQSPQGPLAARCHFVASIAAGHLDQTELELEALTRSIELDFIPTQLARAYCNRGETWMRRGDLARASADFKKGIELGLDPAQQALCYYALAVAQDRNGDTPSAWQALDIALRIHLPLNVYASDDALDLPEVYFLPEYDLHYYKALSRMATARQAPDDERLEQYERALKHWQAYIEAGEKAGDPWLTQARLHAATCRRLLDEAEKPQRKQADRKPKKPARH
jgi:tetratricopeptide (TPR) repeat protein